jgi:hypothetical protein
MEGRSNEENGGDILGKLSVVISFTLTSRRFQLHQAHGQKVQGGMGRFGDILLVVIYRWDVKKWP